MEKKPSRRTSRKCKQCGERFERLASFMKKRNPRFCSVACARSSQIGKRRRANSGIARPACKCETCGDEFVGSRGNANRFCCWACMVEGRKGDKSANWRGGKTVDTHGYVWVRRPDHPRAKGNGGYIREHHAVVEDSIGRLLQKGESVHHINGVRSDNRLENLQLCSSRHGNGQALVCADCGSHNISHMPLKRYVGTD